MTPPRTLGLVPALAILVLLASPTPALADCAMPPPIEEAVKSADIVFIGTVTATSNERSPAIVAVEEVWRGPDQPAQVVMRVGPAGNATTSVDRRVEIGAKYLFVPYLDMDGVLSDNACTSTTPWTADLIGLRPVDARPPIGATAAVAEFDLGGLVAPIVVALIVAAVLLVVGLAARGRQTA